MLCIEASFSGAAPTFFSSSIRSKRSLCWRGAILWISAGCKTSFFLFAASEFLVVRWSGNLMGVLLMVPCGFVRFVSMRPLKDVFWFAQNEVEHRVGTSTACIYDLYTVVMVSGLLKRGLQQGA